LVSFGFPKKTFDGLETLISCPAASIVAYSFPTHDIISYT
jgi:hypothetical protein